MTRPYIFLILAGLAITSGVQAQSPIKSVLDDFHLAASEADYDRYFGHLAEESIFLGTDITERWTKSEFQDYARPHFSAGRGWTYVLKTRSVYIAPDGQAAWFDEILHNEKFGDVRGTGALILEEDTWKIVQYHLTLPVPNDLIGKLVEMINEQAE